MNISRFSNDFRLGMAGVWAFDARFEVLSMPLIFLLGYFEGFPHTLLELAARRWATFMAIIGFRA